MSNFHAPDGSLSIFDNEDINALLIRDQSRLRHDDTFFRLVSFDTDLNELAIDQPSSGFGSVARTATVSVDLVDFDIDEVDFAGDVDMPVRSTSWIITFELLIGRPANRDLAGKCE